MAASLVALVLAAGAPTSATALETASWGDWPTWQKDLFGSRFNPAETKLNPSTVRDLTLKWAFAFPRIPYATARSQPAVVGGTVYFGGPDSKFYALDAKTGATRWTFDLSTVAGPWDDNHQNPVLDGPAVAGRKVYFGDGRGYLYALDRDSGRLVWATRLDTHPTAKITSSPVVFSGRVYIGVSSSESGTGTDYPCCTFRGQIVAVNANTGSVEWRYYTVPPAQQVGTWPSGAAKYEPSGGAVWSTPVIDPATRTLYVGTGQNYTGGAGDTDSVLALNTDTGAVRWKRRMTQADTWRVLCRRPDLSGYCPGLADGTALDFDFGAMPNIFVANGRKLLGIGQKSGVYHTFDAATGEIVWQTQLSVPHPNNGDSGIQWGASYDGLRLYVATWKADPGTLFALDPASGRILWETPNPADGCSWGGSAQYPDLCELGHTPAVTSSPGLVYEGSMDGKMRIYSSETGALLWQYDTVRDYAGVNGLPGRGSALSGNGGAVVADGMLYVQSGYYPFYPTTTGYVLLAFGL